MTNLSRRKFVKSVPAGAGLVLGFESGLITLDSLNSPALANTSQETSNVFQNDIDDYKIWFKTWNNDANTIRNVATYNENNELIYQSAALVDRFTSNDMESIYDYNMIIKDGDGDTAYQDTLLDHTHEDRHRVLVDAPDFSDSYLLEGVLYYRGSIRQVFGAGLRFTTYALDGFVGGIGIEVTIGTTRRTVFISHRNEHFATIRTLLTTIRDNWITALGSGAVATASTVGSTGLFIAGAASVKGGAMVAGIAGGGILLTILALVAGAYAVYKLYSAVKAYLELKNVIESFLGLDTFPI